MSTCVCNFAYLIFLDLYVRSLYVSNVNCGDYCLIIRCRHSLRKKWWFVNCNDKFPNSLFLIFYHFPETYCIAFRSEDAKYFHHWVTVSSFFSQKRCTVCISIEELFFYFSSWLELWSLFLFIQNIWRFLHSEVCREGGAGDMYIIE